ncbi:MAG: glycosyltransferase family 4 protein [Acidobacteriota bacterium]
MRLCMISGETPWPVRGGDMLLTANLINILSPSFDLDLFFINGDVNSLRGVACQSSRVFYSGTTSLTGKRLRQIKSVFFNEPMVVATYNHYGLKKGLNDFIDQSKPDIILFNHIRTSWLIQYLSEKNKRPSIYIAHNAEAATNKSIASLVKGGLIQGLLQNDSQKLTRLEETILNSVNACVVLTEEDKERLKQINSDLLYEVIPPNIDVKGASVDVSQSIDTILLVGSFLWLPKRANAVWMAREIMPAVAKEIPGVKLKIVGAAANTLADSIGSLPYVELHSDVDSVVPYYQSPSIFVVPERQESGIKLKTLEAAGFGLPIVSTPTGAEGTGLVDDYSIMIANSVEQFSEKIMDLLRDSEKRTRLSLNAYGHIQNNFSSAQILNKYSRLFERITE